MGQPCCSPGSIEEILPVLRESIKSAEAWIEAAEAVIRHNEIYRKRSPEDEKRIRETMKKFNCDRANAVKKMKGARDIEEF